MTKTERALIADMLSYGIPIAHIAKQQKRCKKTIRNVRDSLRRSHPDTYFSGTLDSMLNDVMGDLLTNSTDMVMTEDKPPYTPNLTNKGELEGTIR